MNTDMSEVHEELLAFATETLGRNLTVEDRSREFGRKSITLKFTVPGGEAFYLKRHEERRLYETESIAYTKWIPKLRGTAEWHIPELVANSPELGAMLMTEVPGEILDECDARLDDRLAMHRAAGRLAAQIHQLKVDPDEVGPARLYGEETWANNLERGAPYLDSETLRWIERVSAANDLFEGLPIVPTHSDFSPRNWLINKSGETISPGLIDWERARPGYWLEDAARLVFDHWLKVPELRIAFFDGYGQSPTSAEDRQLNLICLSNALATVSWATEHGDFEFAEFGTRVLGLLREELE